MHVRTICVLSCFLPLTLIARAQDRKPGLYDLTIVTTTVAPSGHPEPPRKRQACLTQEMIDKYGAMVPDTPTRACQLANVIKKSGGMTADIVCSGFINGKGTIDVNWTDGEHAKGNLHFSGTIHPGQEDIKVEWSAVTTSAYKGPDCGSLGPTRTPAPVASPAPVPPE